LVIDTLPPNAEDKSYQLWVIRSDQPKPQSVAVFDVTPSVSKTVALEKFPQRSRIKTVAVSLEAKGGAGQPSSTKYVLSGKP
jgi:anti-sigma-K factor RskA